MKYKEQKDYIKSIEKSEKLRNESNKQFLIIDNNFAYRALQMKKYGKKK